MLAPGPAASQALPPLCAARPGPARPPAALPIRPGRRSPLRQRREPREGAAATADPPPRIAAAARVRYAGGPRRAAAAGRGKRPPPRRGSPPLPSALRPVAAGNGFAATARPRDPPGGRGGVAGHEEMVYGTATTAPLAADPPPLLPRRVPPEYTTPAFPAAPLPRAGETGRSCGMGQTPARPIRPARRSRDRAALPPPPPAGSRPRGLGVEGPARLRFRPPPLLVASY